MDLPHQPKCMCLECRGFSLVYSSIADMHKCLECESEMLARHVNTILAAFTLFRSSNPPMLVQKYNEVYCVACQKKGGIAFTDTNFPMSKCDICKYSVPVSYFHEAVVMAYKTKLLETSYNKKYTVFGQLR